MGNARWKGARLKDILDRAGLAKDSNEITFEGADGQPVEKTPDFVKSIPVWKALDPDTLVAYEMNGQALPHFHDAPARIIVPGWTATYWMKHVNRITARSTPEDNLNEGRLSCSCWQVPACPPVSKPGDGRRHTDHRNGRQLHHHDAGGRRYRHLGPDAHHKRCRLGWRGHGITSVEVSTNEGQTLARAALGPDAGRYSFRQWSFPVRTGPKGTLALLAHATNVIGQTQASALIQNPAGYHHKLVHRISVTVA